MEYLALLQLHSYREIDVCEWTYACTARGDEEEEEARESLASLSSDKKTSDKELQTTACLEEIDQHPRHISRRRRTSSHRAGKERHEFLSFFPSLTVLDLQEAEIVFLHTSCCPS